MFDVTPSSDTSPERTAAADDVSADANGPPPRFRPKGRARGRPHDAGPIDADALKAAADVVDAEIKSLVAGRRKDSVEMVHALARMARGRLFRAYGFADLYAYARSREVPHSPSQVKQMVTLASHLERLPEQREAFQGGRLEWTKAREIAREAIRRGKPEADAELLELALGLSFHDLTREIARARGKQVKRPVKLDFSEEELADVEQAALQARVAEPELTLAQAIARACRAFARSGGAAGDGSAPATRVVIHCAAPATATVESLLEEHEGAVVETRAGPVAVSPARVEEALCNAEVHDVRAGPARVSRTVPAKTARLVHARDGGRCKVPDCPNLGFLHMHHEPGRRAVGHDPSNMLLLCTLCRYRHNVHYADIRIMPSRRARPLWGAEFGVARSA